MLSKTRHWLVLALLALLPFHALFVTVGTKIFVGPGHPPLTVLALWKEVLIAVLLVIAAVELFSKRKFPKIDVVTGIIFALLVLSISTSYKLQATSYVFGFKYLFLPLLVFLICKALPWDKDFQSEKIPGVLLLVGVIVSAYGIVSYFL